MNILGISAFYPDSAACLVRDGAILAAAQEEQFSRKPHDPAFPVNAVKYCVEEGKTAMDDLDYVVFHDKPFVKFKRLLLTYLYMAPKGLRSFYQQMPAWFKQELFMRATIRRELGYSGKILFAAHHQSHAASAFFPSPYEDAAFLTLDGGGEWATSTYGVGEGNRVEILKEITFPHALGLLYSAFTSFTGFKVNSGEYKLMGLAPYGKPRYVDTIYRELIDVKPDGSLRMNMDYFDYCPDSDRTNMTNKRFALLFGGPPRQPETHITQREMDLACSVQEVTEDIILRMGRHIHKETGKKYLTLAGRMALNSVANGRLLREGPFEDIWIQPAANDAGNAVGCALFVWHQLLDAPREVPPPSSRPMNDGTTQALQTVYLGPWFGKEAIESYLKEEKIPHERFAEEEELCERVAQLLSEQKVVGWFQGRMEFGPHALGARSILGDPRSRKLQPLLNRKIKSRESFRPFGLSVLVDQVSDYFELDRESPYRLLAANVHRKRLRKPGKNEKKAKGFEKLNVIRSELPAITHVDNSARIHTVAREDNPLYYRLIERFHEITGCPVIINTSFKVRSEPIACNPAEAFTCFMRTHMDYLVMGPYVLDKKKQAPWSVEEDTWNEGGELD